jgi:hypothetical protein
MRWKLSFVVVVFVLVGAPVSLLYIPAPVRIVFPNGKRFAFSIIDDTDMATLERVKPIYDLLERRGMRTTKTVWLYNTSDPSNPTNTGDSLQNPAYRRFILDLHRKGFEIALHGVRGGSSPRADVIRGFDEFKATFGADPAMYINHAQNNENIYWGWHLFSFAPYRWAGTVAIRHDFSGHDPESEYFWGDIAQTRVRYMRRFTFQNANILAINPAVPYRLADKPYVNYWFPTANGARAIEFDRLLQPDNLRQLEEEGGVCLVYTHLGSGSFNLDDGSLDPRFVRRIDELSARNGWFVPASEILDHLRGRQEWRGDLTFWQSLRVDTRFIAERTLLGISQLRDGWF